MPAASASRGDANETSRPSSSIVPPSGRSLPARIFPSVLLPAPFSPQTAWQVPARTSKLTPDSACAPGKRFVTPVNRIAGSAPPAVTLLEVLGIDVREAP